jgi:hypothetical protein
MARTPEFYRFTLGVDLKRISEESLHEELLYPGLRVADDQRTETKCRLRVVILRNVAAQVSSTRSAPHRFYKPFTATAELYRVLSRLHR